MSEELKRKLRDARAKLGMSQRQLANQLGVSVRTLQAWEADRNTPGWLARMALNSKLDALLGGK